jgi:uroporphyrinogen decarboxylase
MTRKEAIKKVLVCEPVSPLPYNMDFTLELRQKLKDHFNQDDVDQAVGNYMLQINVGSNAGPEINRVAEGLMKSSGENRFVDEWGVEWDKSGGDDIGVPVNRVLNEAEVDLIDVPDVRNSARWLGYDEIAATAGDRYLLASLSSPLFQRAWFLRGMDVLMMDMITNPDFVHALLDRLMEFSIQITREVIRRGADGIFFLDDYAQQTGMLFSPDMFRSFIAPRLEQIFTVAKEGGLDVFFHSCGNVSMILEDIKAIGVHVFNPFQPEVMDVAGLAHQFEGRLAFYGGISTQQTMPFGKPDDIRREILAMNDLYQNIGGYIAAPAHALQRDVPVENVLAFIEAVKET